MGVQQVEDLQQSRHHGKAILSQRCEQHFRFQHQIFKRIREPCEISQNSECLDRPTAHHAVSNRVGHLKASTSHQLDASQLKNILGIEHQPIKVKNHSTNHRAA